MQYCSLKNDQVWYSNRKDTRKNYDRHQRTGLFSSYVTMLNPMNNNRSCLSWLERRLRTCVSSGTSQVRALPYPMPFVSTIYLSLYEFSFLFWLIVFRIGQWTTKTDQVRKKLTTLKNNSCFIFNQLTCPTSLEK